MDHYLDIQVRPDPEFPVNTLLGALVSKLHRALVELKANDLGISLPEYEQEPPLGKTLRLHGTDTRLGALMETGWLRGMRDHLEISEVQAVPAEAAHLVVRRRQYKTNVERLRRRRMKRHNESYEEAVRHIPDSVERKVKMPYVTVRSQSSGQAFSLFIEHGECQQIPVAGTFNTYGLSQGATVPWF
ncbi:type I-F CRISPR-associated endoribonuclease Cas6/Csy4 [Halorhodospira halochloris]|uniref:type I-F CRISPR-associated endoribonuclease Cas6/Csy4 n=1 Tax=Halorhodospira halochloris TaxID=1052 RepID=UPI001EE99A69|nr:type I-F CRISPR-associated endoribonuclease Cas6/Csy4 [Halorhodospira halochloris]MCG5531474.1 type I-F CRISPR-associated endoribonuclease Cas6/Csy4 [Halorhodospira halochloris]MCG5549359.1 type I-F CRISPR-associated endoribonuclease Cas6/Csy4 [Halorhodospira halochloris]